MFRTRAFALPLAAVVAAAVVVPSIVVPSVVSAAATTHIATPACTAGTPSVAGLSAALTRVQTALSPNPDPTKLAPVAGDLFNAIIAVQKDGCLPALPSSSATSTPTNVPSAPPTPPAAGPQAGASADCQSDAVSLLSSALSLVSAALASPPNPAAVTSALSSLATSVTGVNTDSCLPTALPVPSLPPAP